MSSKIYFAILGQKADEFGNRKTTATIDKKNKSRNVVFGVIPSFCFLLCFLVFVLFVVGCNTISRCEPCMPVDYGTEQSAPSTKFNLLSNIYKKQHRPNTNPSAQPKHNSSQKKSNAMSYLTIPPPPESPE
jgi:hypothetical protein